MNKYSTLSSGQSHSKKSKIQTTMHHDMTCEQHNFVNDSLNKSHLSLYAFLVKDSGYFHFCINVYSSQYLWRKEK